MSDNYEQPVEPMSRAEDILRGNTSTVPMSRIEALLKQLIAGGGGGGSTVTITTDYQAGTKIATLTIDGTGYNIYIPTDQIGSIVSISTDYQAGTKIATLTIDDTPYNIYIPQDQVGNRNFVGTTDPTTAVGNDKDLYFKVTTTTKSETLYTEQWNPRSFNVVLEVKYSNVVSEFDTVTVSIHNGGNLTFNYSDIPISDDPVTDGYAVHDEWNFTEFKISRDDTNIYFTYTKWEGTGTWVFQSCSISYSVVTGVSDCFIKKNDTWVPTKEQSTPSTYSTDWVLVDKWIDNSNIYRKVINLGSVVNFPTNNAVDLASYLGTDADNISQIINLRGVLVNSDGTNQNGCGNIGFAYNQNGSRWLAYATNFQSYFTHLVIDAILTTEPS